jgi:hypothetical protein
LMALLGQTWTHKGVPSQRSQVATSSVSGSKMGALTGQATLQALQPMHFSRFRITLPLDWSLLMHSIKQAVSQAGSEQCWQVTAKLYILP